jgi:hypothetical protein
LFCPACPQPGINTPDNWKAQPRSGLYFVQSPTRAVLILFDSWIYRRNIVVDGNFSMEHMKMKNSGDDVFLSDGEGYMVQWAPYKQHLDSSLETKQVCSCSCHSHNFLRLTMSSACHMCKSQSC